MTYVITQSCCNDTSCIPVCPVNCIRPTPDEPDYLIAEMLYIDPTTCIECGACTEVCPVGAIHHEEDLPEEYVRFTEINAAWFERHPIIGDPAVPTAPSKAPRAETPWRVAIVGSGPAGTFAAAELLSRVPGVEVEMFDRLPTPWGLARAGVAPDHWGTKEVSEVFKRITARPGFGFHLNVEIGQHLSHEELIDHHHAVLYATGALADRPLQIPGDGLPGSVAAAEFVAWYNGHPDAALRGFDLSGERAVVVGNGNVALDVARVLLSDPDVLATTDIADHALAALRESRVREVVVLGRRGVAEAAYTTAELLALGRLEGVEVVVEGATEATAGSFASELKQQIASEFGSTSDTAADRRLVLRHLTSPTRLLGADRVEAIELVRNELIAGDDGDLRARATDEVSTLETSLVIRSVGFRSTAVPGVPFDHDQGRLPHRDGRVLDAPEGTVVPGIYVTGWAKRGASGVIGTNKLCAAATVDVLVEDLLAGLLPTPTGDRAALVELIAERQPDALDRASWLGIEKHERARGKEQGRPRVKLVDVAEMVAVAHQPSA